jgi:hypothetical protein
LSVIVIPIVCSILALIIVVFGVAYHVNHRHSYTIETADFDFQKHNTDELMEKTFFERMRDTFVNSLRAFFLCGCIHFRWTRLTEECAEPSSTESTVDRSQPSSPVREVEMSSPSESDPVSSASSSSCSTATTVAAVTVKPTLSNGDAATKSIKRSKKKPKRKLDGDSGVHSDNDKQS